VGALLCHGFSSTPQSMRPWAEHLAAAGLSVSAPLLPGHGTRWQDMNTTGFADWYGEAERAFDDLRGRCGTVFVMGQSLGGTLALRLAELRPREVAGLVVVNASLGTDRKDARLVPVVSRVLASFPGIALPRISCPVLAYRSRVDHVVPASSGTTLLRGLAGGTVEERVLEDSYHVATLDNDAPTIFAGSLDFVRTHSPAATP
jgi:carboxylesterase